MSQTLDCPLIIYSDNNPTTFSLASKTVILRFLTLMKTWLGHDTNVPPGHHTRSLERVPRRLGRHLSFTEGKVTLVYPTPGSLADRTMEVHGISSVSQGRDGGRAMTGSTDPSFGPQDDWFTLTRRGPFQGWGGPGSRW